MKLEQLEAALTTINRSIELQPGNSYAYRNKGLILLEMKDTESACNAFQQAIQLNFTPQYGDEVSKLMEEHCP